MNIALARDDHEVKLERRHDLGREEQDAELLTAARLYSGRIDSDVENSVGILVCSAHEQGIVACVDDSEAARRNLHRDGTAMRSQLDARRAGLGIRDAHIDLRRVNSIGRMTPARLQ